MTPQRYRHVASRYCGNLVVSVFAGIAVTACGGGGSSGSAAAPTVTTPVNPAPAPTTVATAAPQVITMALPDTSAIGQLNDPTFGLIGGYTQQVYSQVLGFVPNAQVMIANGQPGVPHSLNVVSQTSFPAAANLATTAAGGSTVSAGFASGLLNGATTIGPVTLSAGTYFIGCSIHYFSNKMRTVLIVAANATPGPQATPVPNNTPQPGPFGY